MKQAIQCHNRYNMNIILILICCLCLNIGKAFAEEALPTNDKTSSATHQDDATHQAEEEFQAEDFQEWAFFPVIASETETGLQLGGLAVRFFKPESNEFRTSTIDFVAFGTVNQQYYTGVTSDFYLKRDLYHLNLTANGRFWPANFYGIGNDTTEEDKKLFESTGLDTRIVFERKFIDLLYAGVLYKFRNSWIEPESPESEGVLQNESLTGAEGGLRSGLGITLSLDTRDNVNDARDGTFIKADALYFEDSFGSDFDYSLYTLDMRQFITLARVTGLGIRGYVQLMRGDIPFQDLSSPNGYNILRGLENGRYRDRDMIAFQAEWRFPIYKRFGGTVFMETAQVAEDLSDIHNDGWTSGAGVGLRYAINYSEKFNTRIDFSWVDGGFGLTIGMREAF
ncbi:MAG: BamA/TamA family outer membrane protein [Deltaproteobacteria bacterium]|nr:BamA/TamA family outer membrane protein [Deltaproteobacteria bacterium]MBW2220119.1 BamA/TamA family outer membrane protein [Deltaproteobacteria bacterium]